MALPTSVSDINAFTDKELVPRTTDVVYKKSPLFVRLFQRKNISFDGGTLIQRPVMYAKLNGGAFSKGETFNTAYVQTDTAVQVTPKHYHVNVSLYGTDDVLNRGRNAAFSQVEIKMFNASMRMAELLAKGAYGDGQSSDADVVTSSNVLSNSKNLDGLLAWLDDGNDDSTYATDTNAGRSFASIGGITRSDMFTTAPTFSGATTVAGAKGGLNSYVNRSFTNFTLSGINTAYGEAWYGNEYPDLIVTSQAGWNKFWNAIQPNQRYMDKESDVGKIGFRAFRFNGASEVVVDQYMPSSLMLGINTSYIEMFISTNPKFQFGFTGFKETANSIDLAGQFLFAGNLIYPNPRLCFKLYGSGLA